MESIHKSSNSRFEMSVVYLRLNILLVVYDVPIKQREALDDRLCESQDQAEPVFQRYSYDRVYVRVFIGGAHTCINICVLSLFISSNSDS
jgi:hypothetical protein